MRHHRVERVAAGLGVVKIPRRIDLQAHCELMEVFRDLMVVVEVLDEVRLAVAVQIAQAHELIAAGDEQIVTTKLHAQRLEESARDAPPAQRRRRSRHHAIHAPHVAVPGGHDGGLAIGREIKAARTHPAVPRILHRQRISL